MLDKAQTAATRANVGQIGRGYSEKPHSITCDFLIGYRELTRSLGGDPDELLAAAGLSPNVLERTSTRITVEALSDVLETTAEALHCLDFGMRLAEIQSRQPFEPLDPLLSSAPTLADVLSCSCAHSAAYSSVVTSILELDAERGMTFMRMELPEEVACKVQLVEQFALLINNAVIRLSGAKARSREIWFLHAPSAPPVAYARQFRTVVRFHQGFHGLFFSEFDLRAPVVGHNEVVFLTERRNFASRFPVPQISIETRVRRAVERGFAEGSCTRERVAVLTELHERTLHRRLAAAGTTFQAIREEVRRKLALRYLAQPDLSLMVVTELLGYSEPAVLSRSCQRWFNAPPAELRRRLTHPDC